MAYTKTTWIDRAVQFANRFTKSGETASSVTLTPDPGTVTQAGTPLNAANLNKLEEGVRTAHVTADAALPKAGGKMTAPLRMAPYGSTASTWSVPIYFEVIDGLGVSKTNNYFQADPSNNIRYIKDGVNRLIVTDETLRTTNGYPEIFINGGWLPLGGATIGASNTVQHSFPTEYVYTTVGNKLVAKFAPKGTGDLIVSADLRGTGSSNSSVLYYFNPLVIAGDGDHVNYIDDIQGPDWSMPLGSNVSIASGAMDSLLSLNGTTYTTVSAVLRIHSKDPVYLLFSSSELTTGAIKNIQIKYDVIG